MAGNPWTQFESRLTKIKTAEPTCRVSRALYLFRRIPGVSKRAGSAQSSSRLFTIMNTLDIYKYLHAIASLHVVFFSCHSFNRSRSSCMHTLPASDCNYLLHIPKFFNMPSIHRIISKELVGSAVKDGKTMTLSIATETSSWRRLNTAIEPSTEVLQRSLAVHKSRIPEGTVDICLRYIYMSDCFI